jgi:glutaredoxin
METQTTQNIPTPIKNQFTVYSKSGCTYCIQAKELLTQLQLVHTIIDCDIYLETDKELFLHFIHQLSSINYTSFPMIFDGKTFVGGYSNIQQYVDRLLNFDVCF